MTPTIVATVGGAALSDATLVDGAALVGVGATGAVLVATDEVAAVVDTAAEADADVDVASAAGVLLEVASAAMSEEVRVAVVSGAAVTGIDDA